MHFKEANANTNKWKLKPEIQDGSSRTEVEILYRFADMLEIKFQYLIHHLQRRTIRVN